MIDHFNLVQQALAQLDHDAVQRAIDIIKAAKQRGSMIFICGNGGSAATASHFACDLQKAAGVRAIALTDNVPLITAWANDEEYSRVYDRQYQRLMNNTAGGNVVIILSCSGVSKSVVNMLMLMGSDIQHTIALFGAQGSTLKGYDNSVPIIVQSLDYGVIEDCHLAICHAITKGVRDATD